MRKEGVDEFEKVVGQLYGLHTELAGLAKKSPNDPLNAFKLKLVNDLLGRANVMLSDAYRPFSQFDQFDADDIPSNSDVAMMISQYIEASEKLRADNVIMSSGHWHWLLEAGDKTLIRTSPPLKNINRK